MKCFVAGVLAWVLCAPLVWPNPKASKTKTRSQSTAELVWPGPPERPRIRYLAAIQGSEDVTGNVKPSFVERISGRSPFRDQMRLLKPYGIAIDGSNRIFVADPAQRAVLIFDRTTRAATRWRGSAQFPLFLPIGLAFDADGRLFVSDSFAAQVLVFNPDGKPVAGFGKNIFKRPGGLAVDTRRSRLYAADVQLNQVLVFDTRTFQMQKTIGGASTAAIGEPGRFSGPTNLALDSTGRLFVTDTWNCRVQVFDPDGKFVLTFGAQGTQPGRFARPKGIAIDREDHVYVVDAEFNNFQVFTREGKPLLFVGSIGLEPGQFLLPAGMAIDRENRIYVTEQRMSGGRLQIFQYLPERASADSREETYARR
jgi:DNA-binding beta-propeller fold protein YncE